MVAREQALHAGCGKEVGIVNGAELELLTRVTRVESEVEFRAGFMHGHALDLESAEGLGKRGEIEEVEEYLENRGVTPLALGLEFFDKLFEG